MSLIYQFRTFPLPPHLPFSLCAVIFSYLNLIVVIDIILFSNMMPYSLKTIDQSLWKMFVLQLLKIKILLGIVCILGYWVNQPIWSRVGKISCNVLNDDSNMNHHSDILPLLYYIKKTLILKIN